MSDISYSTTAKLPSINRVHALNVASVKFQWRALSGVQALNVASVKLQLRRVHTHRFLAPPVISLLCLLPWPGALQVLGQSVES